MFFDLPTLSQPVKAVLRKHEGVLLPLTRFPRNGNEEDSAKLLQAPASHLFPGASHADAALSGLFLLLNCWEQSHHISQGIGSEEGSYWHGIAHRIEPDSFNAGYWFRRVRSHPVFPELHQQARQILSREAEVSKNVHWQLKRQWDPFLFIDWCDEARANAGGAHEQIARQIQDAEWRLLFGWCASPLSK